jgi:YebC/PmpR family DNA-binding regulatory protein
MGRVFEKRKYKMFARYDRMAKTFTRIGKEIAIAVKQGGPDPGGNPRLRLAIQNAKGANMPKDRVDAAIKRASSKEEKDFEEMVYEGYGPFGVAILVECATDNPTRTVANIRMYFNRAEGTLGKTGSLDFIFERKGVFRIKAAGQHVDDLELDLIDHGLQDIFSDEEDIVIYTNYNDFGVMQKALESKSIEVRSAVLQRIPNSTTQLNEQQEDAVIQLVEKFEQDEDVQAVYHNMK